MKRDSRQTTAGRGEDGAVAYLRDRGYRIVTRNWRCRLGEIDIVARDGETLVFVEVKSRRSSAFGTPQAAVDGRKQRKLSLAALQYLQDERVKPGPARFDVVAVTVKDDGDEIELIRNAFDVCR
jgi:putative endonuclease